MTFRWFSALQDGGVSVAHVLDKTGSILAQQTELEQDVKCTFIRDINFVERETR